MVCYFFFAFSFSLSLSIQSINLFCFHFPRSCHLFLSVFSLSSYYLSVFPSSSLSFLSRYLTLSPSLTFYFPFSLSLTRLLHICKAMSNCCYLKIKISLFTRHSVLFQFFLKNFSSIKKKKCAYIHARSFSE